jgi:hypothetical protein
MNTQEAIRIIEEDQDATFQQELEAWAHMIATGLCWQLQGFYIRGANAFINEGIIDAEGTINWDKVNEADDESEPEYEDREITTPDPYLGLRPLDKDSEQTLWLKETYVVYDERRLDKWGDPISYISGENDWYETYWDAADAPGKIFRDLQREHGKCTGHVYIDTTEGTRKSDSSDTYLSETWVEFLWK